MPEPQLGVGIIGEVENDIPDLLPRSSGFGWLGRMGGLGGSLEWGFNIPLLPRLPTRFPFISVTTLLSTPAQILHSGGLVSLQHHRRSAVGSQLLTAGHNTSIIMFNCLQVPVAGVTLSEHCAWFEQG